MTRIVEAAIDLCKPDLPVVVPAFIIEELDDGRLTVFVPSVPTPLAGAVYVPRP